MNKIKYKRLILSGVLTFIAFIVIAILWEGIIARALFKELNDVVDSYILQNLNLHNWSASNHILNSLIVLMQVTGAIWLYAALRPMFGVGTKTALITSTLIIFIALSEIINQGNIGKAPLGIMLIDFCNTVIELPLAIMIGAKVYEFDIDE